LPQEKITELLERYNKLDIAWANFKGNYVYFGPYERVFIEEYNFSADQFELIFNNNQVKIYLII